MTKLRSRLTYANVAATLALFLALGGGTTAIALRGTNTVDSGDIIKGQVKSSDLKNNGAKSKDVLDDTLTGNDIDESSLGQVPSAADADALGGVAASSYQQKCQNGAVTGYILVNGDAGGFPTTYTSTATFVPEGFNCSGSAPLARRIAAGDFAVCFPSSFARIAIATPVNSAAGGQDNIVSWGRLSDGTCTGGVAAEVKVIDNDGTTAEDQRFSLLLLK